MSSNQVPSTADEHVPLRLLAVRFGTSIEDWRKAYSDAVWRPYRHHLDEVLDGYDERPPGMEGEGFWCATAMESGLGFTMLAVFYAQRAESPLTCRLETVMAVVTVPSRAEASRTYTAAVRVFEDSFGTGTPMKVQEARRPWGGSTGYPDGIGAWEEAHRWDLVSGTLWLSQAAAAVTYVMESDFRSSDESADALEGVGPPTVAGRPLIDWQLHAALRQKYGAAADALLVVTPPSSQDVVRPALMRFLEARQKATGSAQMLATLAVDRLARLLWLSSDDPATAQTVERLRKASLSFVFDGHQELWVYEGNLALEIIRRWPFSRWGELAFVEQLHAGWNEDCSGDEYLSVIKHGKAWLAAHPRSPWRPSVMSAVAQAHETAWSRFAAFATGDGVPLVERIFAPRPNKDRDAAIQLYDLIIETWPTSAEAAHARRRIVQLKRGIDTGQMRFACFIA